MNSPVTSPREGIFQSASDFNPFIWKPKSDSLLSYPNVSIAAAQAHLDKGMAIDKLTTGGSINNRIFRVDRHGKFGNFLSWKSPKKKIDASRVDLA